MRFLSLIMDDLSNETDVDISLGDYLTEDDIPDYKLREISERREQREEIPFAIGQTLNEYLLQQLSLRTCRKKRWRLRNIS